MHADNSRVGQSIPSLTSTFLLISPRQEQEAAQLAVHSDGSLSRSEPDSVLTSPWVRTAGAVGAVPDMPHARPARYLAVGWILWQSDGF
jgi:hypothetical protein